MSTEKPIKQRVKNFLLDAFQGSMGTAHLMSSYVTDAIEWSEKKVVHKFEPEQQEEDIVRARRNSTIRYKHQIAQEVARIKRDIRDMTRCDMSEADETAFETEQFGG